MNCEIPFILVTGNWSDQYRHRILRKAAFEMLAKPSLQAELFQHLKQQISPQVA